MGKQYYDKVSTHPELALKAHSEYDAWSIRRYFQRMRKDGFKVASELELAVSVPINPTYNLFICFRFSP